ncbi:uncharacterized [Tachysurus ichikawai]
MLEKMLEKLLEKLLHQSHETASVPSPACLARVSTCEPHVTVCRILQKRVDIQEASRAGKTSSSRSVAQESRDADGSVELFTPRVMEGANCKLLLPQFHPTAEIVV